MLRNQRESDPFMPIRVGKTGRKSERVFLRDSPNKHFFHRNIL